MLNRPVTRIGPGRDGRTSTQLGAAARQRPSTLARLEATVRDATRSDLAATRVTWLLAGAVAVVSLLHARRFFHDDAYITFRYVARFLNGQGLTWTAGAPVEGYTHPLWLAQLAVLGALDMDLELASRLLGVGYLAAIFALWWRARAWPVPLLAFAALPGTALWALGGLEMMGYLFWLLLGALGTLRVAGVWPRPADGAEPPSVALAAGAGLALGIATLHRPDGLVFCGLAAVAVALGPYRWRAVPLALAAAVPVGGWMVFRLAYYGALQAAPAMAKASGIPLWIRLDSFANYLLESAPAWLPAAAVAAAALLWRPSRVWLGLFGVSLAAVLPAVLGGGDHMLGGRLFLPFTALVCLGAGLRWASERPPPLLAATLLGAALFHGAHLLEDEPGRDPAAVWGRIMGEFLEEHLPPGTLVATATAGSTPYFSPQLEYIDTLGLNDAHIARRQVWRRISEWQSMPGHLKGDGEYVLDRRPDVIIRGGAAGNSDIVFLTDHELDLSERFRREYREYVFVVPTSYLTELGATVPDRVKASGRARLITWLRIDSDRVDALRALGERRPPVAKEPPQLFEPGTRCVERRVTVARDEAGQRSVEFRWRAPPGHSGLYLDLQEVGDPLARSFRVTDLAHFTVTLPAGSYRWRVSAKVDRWRPSEWRPLLVERCPEEVVAGVDAAGIGG